MAKCTLKKKNTIDIIKFIFIPAFLIFQVEIFLKVVSIVVFKIIN